LYLLQASECLFQGWHLISVYLMGVYLIGVYLTGVYLMGVYSDDDVDSLH
jgi:hypothetical protein